MEPVQFADTIGMGTSSTQDRQARKKQGYVPDHIRKLAEKTCRLLCFDHSKEELPRTEYRIATADVEAAIRRGQWMCENLVDETCEMQSQEQAARASRRKLEEKIERYNSRRGTLVHRIPATREDALVLERELREVNEVLKDLDSLLEEQMVEERDRRTDLQRRCKDSVERRKWQTA